LFKPSLATPGRSASWVRRLSVISVAVLLVACGKAEAPAAAPPGGGMPAPEVGVVTVAPGDVGLQTELPGRLEASRVAQVRARAAGILQQRLFKEGSDVKAGQALFRIDAAPYQATLQSARAGLARAEANLAQATEGALVGQGEATPLALIQQVDPLFVNFTQSAAEAMKLQRALASGQLKGAGAGAASVRVVLEDGSEYAKPGRLLFSDLTVDPTTGQVTLRAEVPNPGGTLLPGLYVRVRLEQATARDAISLPQQAVTRSAQGDSVQVVAADGKIEKRTVKIGGQQNGKWVVLQAPGAAPATPAAAAAPAEAPAPAASK